MKRRKTLSLALAVALFISVAAFSMSAMAEDPQAPITVNNFGGYVLKDEVVGSQEFDKRSDAFLLGTPFVLDNSSGKENFLIYAYGFFNNNKSKWWQAEDLESHPYVTYQIAPGSSVTVYYNTFGYDFSVCTSPDGVVWSELAVTPTPLPDDDPIYSDESNPNGKFVKVGTPMYVTFDLPEGANFIRIIWPQIDASYKLGLSVIKASGGTDAPAFTYDTEHIVADALETTLSGFESTMADPSTVFNVEELGGVKALSVKESYTSEKDSVTKPWVVYRVKENTQFRAQFTVQPAAENLGLADPKFYVSADKSDWAEVPVIVSGSRLTDCDLRSYTASIPEGKTYVKVEYPIEKSYAGATYKYVVGDNGTDIGSNLVAFAKAQYTAPEVGSDRPVPDKVINITNDETAMLAEMAGFSAGTLDFTQKLGEKQLMVLKYGYCKGKTEFEKPWLVYRVDDNSIFDVDALVHVFMKGLELDLKFYVSSDNSNWTEMPASRITDEEEAPGWTNRHYELDPIGEGNKYVKIEYPNDRDYTGTELEDGTVISNPVNFGFGIWKIAFIAPSASSDPSSDPSDDPSEDPQDDPSDDPSEDPQDEEEQPNTGDRASMTVYLLLLSAGLAAALITVSVRKKASGK